MPPWTQWGAPVCKVSQSEIPPFTKGGLRGIFILRHVMLALAICVPAVSAAEPQTYQVEMLIFTNEDACVADGGTPAQPLIQARAATELREHTDCADFQRLPALGS